MVSAYPDIIVPIILQAAICPDFRVAADVHPFIIPRAPAVKSEDDAPEDAKGLLFPHGEIIVPFKHIRAPLKPQVIYLQVRREDSHIGIQSEPSAVLVKFQVRKIA